MLEIVTKSQRELKQMMDARHRLSKPLLQWIISSNRCHIVKLSQDKQLEFIKTKHQFLLHSSRPAKEAAFVKVRNLYGSAFALHGSPIENWCSVMRRGLLNASSTQLQRNASAYNTGIKFSPSSTTSFRYSIFLAAVEYVEKRFIRPAIFRFHGPLPSLRH